jgi:hypothetical protein
MLFFEFPDFPCIVRLVRVFVWFFCHSEKREEKVIFKCFLSPRLFLSMVRYSPCMT